ncbi:unnamed protein product [Urochloa humidicola]
MSQKEGKTSSSHVKLVHQNDWQESVNKAKEENKLLVMEFMASWSEPSKVMKPILEDTIAPDFKDRAVFCMLDIDEFKHLARWLRVEALPTFLLVKGYSIQKRVVGVNKDALKKSINDLIETGSNNPAGPSQ